MFTYPTPQLNNRLFLICPDCHLEAVVRRYFQGQVFFLTALGTSFDAMEFGLASEINAFVERENITEICLVADHACRFLKAAFKDQHDQPLPTEKELRELRWMNNEKLASIHNPIAKHEEFAKINLYKQLNQLLDNACIGHKISSGVLNVRGFLFHRSAQSFEAINIANQQHAYVVSW